VQDVVIYLLNWKESFEIKTIIIAYNRFDSKFQAELINLSLISRTEIPLQELTIDISHM